MREQPGSKIVVFIDDLDRCTPKKALDVLESMKSFFDIKGIVYVIGFNYKSIDKLIETKYGKESGVDGLNYMQKMVKLPFQIPTWTVDDIAALVKNVISKGLEN
ncbi:MAG TPA: P-loop NTPase fold protein, partial [Nitrososphaeraceae archaeon]